MIDREPTDRSSNKVAKDQSSKNLLHETSISEKTLGHREMVKHMVYQNCHSTPFQVPFLSHEKLCCLSPLVNFLVSSFSYTRLLPDIYLFLQSVLYLFLCAYLIGKEHKRTLAQAVNVDACLPPDHQDEYQNYLNKNSPPN